MLRDATMFLKSGGLYWSDDSNDSRDFVKGFDSNEKIKNKIATKIMLEIKSKANNVKVSEEEIISILKDSGLFDITEYGRAVHAEMEALLTCARAGISQGEALSIRQPFLATIALNTLLLQV